MRRRNTEAAEKLKDIVVFFLGRSAFHRGLFPKRYTVLSFQLWSLSHYNSALYLPHVIFRRWITSAREGNNYFFLHPLCFLIFIFSGDPFLA